QVTRAELGPSAPDPAGGIDPSPAPAGGAECARWPARSRRDPDDITGRWRATRISRPAREPGANAQVHERGELILTRAWLLHPPQTHLHPDHVTASPPAEPPGARVPARMPSQVLTTTRHASAARRPSRGFSACGRPR